MTPGVWRSATVDSALGMPSSGIGAIQVAVTAFANGNGASTLDLSESLATPKPETVLNFGISTNSNTAIVAAGSDGKILFRTSTASDVIIDVQGYYTAGDPAEGGFVPVPPKRIVQSSTGLGIQGPLAALSTHVVSIPSSAGVATDASAVFVNIAISATGSNGYAVAFPSDAQVRPALGMDYLGSGNTSSFGTTVPLGADGTFKIFVSTGPDDLAIDITGYFDGSTSSGAFTPAQASIAQNVSINSGVTKAISVSGVNGIPANGSGISSVAMNLQATTSQTSGARITVWPTSISTPPNTTALSIPSGSSGTTSNFVTAQLGTDGRVNVYNRGPDNITLTISADGWYTSVGLPITNGQFQTEQSVSLQADPHTDAAYVSYWYRAGTTAALTQLPATSMTDGDGNHPASALIQKSGSAFPAYTWNIADTLAAANGGVAPDSVIQIEACYRSDPNAAGSCGALLNVDFSQSAFGMGYATADLGPGTLSEVSGDFAVDATDADASVPLGGLTVQRTFTTLTPVDGGVAAGSQRTDASGVFGPGWAADLPSGGDGDLTVIDHPGDYITFTGPDGAAQEYALNDSDGTYPLMYVGLGTASTTGATVAKTDPNDIAMTEPDDTVTTWTGSASSWRVASVGQHGSNSVTTYTYNASGLPTRILAPVPAGLSCASPDSTPGCRSLVLSYESLTIGTVAVTRVQSISVSAPQTESDTPVPVADFDYTSAGWLADSYDPRVTPHLQTAYTYGAAGRLATVAPPGQAPWNFTYDSRGRLSTVYRHDPSGVDATSTVIYGVPLSGTGLPDVTATTDGHWDEVDDLPVTGTAIFRPDHVPAVANGTAAAADWPSAAIDYYDVNGQVVNTAGYGAGAWQIDTVQYDSNGNDVWSLTAANRNQALAPSSDTDPYVAALPSNVDRSAALASTTLYNPSYPWLVTDTFGPTHPIALQDGTVIDARAHVTTKFDEDAPNPDISPLTNEPYNLATSTTTSAYNVATDMDTVFPDASVTHDGYDPIDGSSSTGPTSGWTLGEPTTSTVEMGASPDPQRDLVTKTRYDAKGRVVEHRLPGDGNGTTPRTTLTTYYSAGGSGSCISNLLVGFLCSTAPAAQPATGSPLPIRTYSYDGFGNETSRVETYGSGNDQITRTTTVSYDSAERISSSSVSVTPASAGGIALPTVTYDYYPDTGLPRSESTGTGSSTVAITNAYNELGEATSYTDATGNTSITTYDVDGRIHTLDDGKGTTTITWDSSTEHRGLVTSEDVGVSGSPSTFSATYDGSGDLAVETYPNGLTARRNYDNAGELTGLSYAKSGTTWMSFAQAFNPLGEIANQASPQSNQSLTYDAADRLISVQDTSGSSCTTRVYGFNADSDRASLKSFPATASGTCTTGTTPTTTATSFDQADRDTDTGYLYDGLGRTLTVPAIDAQGIAAHATTAGPLAVGYYANDMVASEAQGSATMTFALDPDQSRISTSSDGTTTTTNHYDDESDSPGWTSSGGSSWTRNLLGPDSTLAATTDQAGNVTLDLTNPHGDVVATCTDTADATGSSSANETTEYGVPRTASVAYGTYGYLGAQQRSSDSLGGLVLMGVRLYDPLTGRFLTPDPVTGGNANAYVYPADPVNSSDTSGTAAKLHNPPRTVWKYVTSYGWKYHNHFFLGQLTYGTGSISFVLNHNSINRLYNACCGSLVKAIIVAGVLLLFGYFAGGVVGGILTLYATYVIWELSEAHNQNKYLLVTVQLFQFADSGGWQPIWMVASPTRDPNAACRPHC